MEANAIITTAREFPASLHFVWFYTATTRPNVHIVVAASYFCSSKFNYKNIGNVENVHVW